MAVARSADRDPETLSLRRLNRALLARQMLLKRARLDPVTAIERLGALQAQWPRAPFIGLWSRLAKFEREHLEDALRDRRVVKATLMRGTLHLASAADYPSYAVATPEARRSLWESTQRQLLTQMARAIPEAKTYVGGGGTGIADGAKMHEAVLTFTATPRSREELIDLIVRRAKMPPEVAVHLVWNFIAAHGMLVHEPESAFFATNRAGNVVAARAALRRMKTPDLAAAMDLTVARYLAAFGPATVEDVSSWTSIRTPPIREAIARLGKRAVTFRDERGRTLFDLAKAPRPVEDTDAPVRYLPKWDSTLLAYTPPERVRILPEKHRSTVIIKNGDVAQTFLVDGMVAGTWTVVRKGTVAVLELSPFRRLARADRTALVDEGERLVRFIVPEARAHHVRA
jgi:hypothetical protein